MSLIDTDRQLRLTTVDDPAHIFADAEAAGEYTGERLFHHRREIYDIIVRMLREGLSCITIARLVKCAEKTVAGVRDRELAHLAPSDYKAALGQRWGQAAHVAIDIIQEIAQDPERRKKVSMRDAAITASISTQNHQLLGGEPTVRVDIAPGGESGHDELNNFLAAIRAPAAPELPAATNSTTRPAVVVEVPAE